MVVNTTLADSVLNYLTYSADPTVMPAGDWIAELQAAASEFELAPDIWIDVKRLPVSVVNLTSLVDHLRTIRDELKNPTDDTKESGRLKLYKLFVCCIHAYHGYISSGQRFGADVSDLVMQIFVFAPINPPSGLSAKGLTLWRATFDPSNSRGKSCLATLIMFSQAGVSAAGPSPPDDSGSGDDSPPDDYHARVKAKLASIKQGGMSPSAFQSEASDNQPSTTML